MPTAIEPTHSTNHLARPMWLGLCVFQRTAALCPEMRGRASLLRAALAVWCAIWDSPGAAFEVRSLKAIVFRAVVLSIVLTLVAGPEAALLCRGWCQSQSAAASACHRERPSAASTVISGDKACADCDKVGIGAVQFVREDMRRSVSAPDAVHAIVDPRYPFAPSTADIRPGQERWREWSLKEQPLLTARRI